MKFSCNIANKLYKDVLNDHYGIGNVQITFKDVFDSVLSMNNSLINEKNTYLITPYHIAKELDINTLRFMGYEVMSY